MLDLSMSQLNCFKEDFTLPYGFLKFVHPSNYNYLACTRSGSVFLGFSQNQLAIQRLQSFIRYFGRSGSPFLYFLSAKGKRRERYIAHGELFSYFFKPVFFLSRYRPGLLTNWRSRLSSLFFYLPYSRAGRLGARLPAQRRLAFPALLLCLNAFEGLYLFSEAEQMGLPVIGPGSYYLDRRFWTYSYPILKYTTQNVNFFMRLFALNYLRGRISYVLPSSGVVWNR